VTSLLSVLMALTMTAPFDFYGRYSALCSPLAIMMINLLGLVSYCFAASFVCKSFKIAVLLFEL
jgi:hypothetical protein